MADIQITNCHTHTFTDAHVPKYFPHPAALPFREIPGLARGASGILSLFGQERLADSVDRLVRFRETGSLRRQADVLARMRRQYSAGTRFVVLPMDMAHAGFGPVRHDLRRQHDELAALAAESEGTVIPFASCYPDAPESVAEARRAIEALGFRGLKLYPRLGFAPDHPALTGEMYPLLIERNLPVMSHCSRGGVQGRGFSDRAADRVTDPRAFLPVLDAHPGLRVCLAHFGGQADWKAYVDEGIPPGDPEARRKNWLASILDLIRSGEHPGLWTDISYTLFTHAPWVPFLKVFLSDERVLGRTLFGSDFYMTRQERLSERAVSVRLRDALGEDTFRRIAETNPAEWLGEA